MAGWVTMRGCLHLAVLWALGWICCNAEAQCKESEDSSARSMLNLKMRMNSQVEPVREHEARDVLAPPAQNTSVQSVLEEFNAAIANLSDTVIMKVYNATDKPADDHSGLPGDVVVTTVVIKCGDPVFAPLGHCPDNCPFFAQTSKVCFFKCVKAADCGTEDPDDRVPDKELGVCRPCNNRGCKTCAPGNKDKCQECKKGYSLTSDGECSSDFVMVWKCIIIFISVVMLFFVLWMIQLACAPITNAEGLQEGLNFRTSVKMHMPAEEGEDPSDLWPISTNLHVTPQVAGPGLTLHMNFQLASVVWSCIMIVVWIAFVYMTDARQLTIGLIPAQTQPELCAVTLQGRSLQEEQMPFKVTFVVIAYLITFIGALAYGAVNLRAFEACEDETSMNDFAALVTGMPRLPGDGRWEEKLKQLFADKTGEKVVGVSICWDFAAQADDVADLLEGELTQLEDYPPVEEPQIIDTRSSLQKSTFGGVDTLMGGVFGLSVPSDDAKEGTDEAGVVDMLTTMKSTTSCFVIFETEAGRDRAVETTQKLKKGLPLKLDGEEHQLRLKREVCEPLVVIWENFDVTTGQFAFRLASGIVAIIVACVVYAVCFYLPYAYYQSMFKFPNEPGAVEGLIFSMLVVAGNQIMYQICAAIADWCGFRFRDRSEGIYVCLYVLAVLLSVFFDMSVEFYLGYHSMADSHVHTADGRSLEDLTSYQEIFESYPMQKVLGKRLFDYCFPATFLVPFMVEPVGTIVVPLFLQKLLLRTHPEVRNRDAEKSVECFAPMDLGRYGDILLNIWLVVLILFFPSGSILPLLLAYAVSHLYIYVYDQYRILRCVPGFSYSTDEVDKYSQLLMILPCCTVAAIIVFKANCTFDGGFCYDGYDVGVACAVAMLAHFVLHLLCLEFVVPAFSKKAHLKSEESYQQVAAKDACTWFSTNPVNCLRSKYIYNDSPPCVFWMEGKQHLIRKNPKIGCYYEHRQKAKMEEY